MDLLIWMRRRVDKDDGFSLVELLVVVLIMSAFMLILYSSMDSFLRINDVTQGRSFSLASSRSALERAAKEIRAANPISLQSPVTLYNTQVSFNVYCSQVGVNGCTSLNLRPVTFTVVNNAFVQQRPSGSSPIVGPEGPEAVPIAERRGSVVNPSTRPVFRYYDRQGVMLNATGGASGDPATDFRDCTRRVEILLIVVSEHRRPNSTIQLTTDVDLRNFHRISTC
jgi:prepilin-type N-terminal cleavage/methylation domain-containing protein